ncbi:MAG: hypothetical protein CL676_00400, partial [Bdellovibrionaceae bacterium]|nr:hypothetical protein [Pseudobdellovibrionaceae bacterium]
QDLTKMWLPQLHLYQHQFYDVARSYPTIKTGEGTNGGDKSRWWSRFKRLSLPSVPKEPLNHGHIACSF